MKFQFIVLYQCQIEHFFKGVRSRLAGVGGSSAQSSCTKEYKSFGLRAPIYLYSRLGFILQWKTQEMVLWVSDGVKERFEPLTLLILA